MAAEELSKSALIQANRASDVFISEGILLSGVDWPFDCFSSVIELLFFLPLHLGYFGIIYYLVSRFQGAAPNTKEADGHKEADWGDYCDDDDEDRGGRVRVVLLANGEGIEAGVVVGLGHGGAALGEADGPGVGQLVATALRTVVESKVVGVESVAEGAVCVTDVHSILGIDALRSYQGHQNPKRPVHCDRRHRSSTD
jgi:hypothetical protein